MRNIDPFYIVIVLMAGLVLALPYMDSWATIVRTEAQMEVVQAALSAVRLGESEDVFNIRAAPLVNGLVIVADDADVNRRL